MAAPEQSLPEFSSPSPDPMAEHTELRLRDPTARLSLPFALRLPITALLSFTIGLSLGITHGSSAAGLRFRAENAHRLPTNNTGWYLYHKSKNYHMMLGGLKEGVKMGTKVGLWSTLFFGVEEAVDRARGFRGRTERSGDVFSTLIAGLGVAGTFSVWNQFPLPTAARTAKVGLAFGIVYGLSQDALSLLKGRKLGYVEF
ncbi:hypothetical protein LTR60_002947, partial [Cryomyces antarcticus]